MHLISSLATSPAARPVPVVSACPAGLHARPANPHAGLDIADTLKLLSERLAPRRRVVRAGEVLYAAGERFRTLYVLNAGLVKIVSTASDGREQVVGIKFRGDWLGFDGIAEGLYACEAVAVDTGEVWGLVYNEVLAACAESPALLGVLHSAMSRQIGRDRESLMSVCTLPADARVAEFLRQWAESLERSGLRFDQITLPLTRAEIGNFLGMTLETVSRALSKLAREGVIDFTGKGRRDIRIGNTGALAAFVRRCLAPVRTLPRMLQ